MRAGRSRRIALALMGVIAFGLFLASTDVGHAGDRGRCFSVIIDEPFSTPDGASHTPGRLTLCNGMTHSPVSSLHPVYKDGLAVAMLMSRDGTSEGIPEDGRPFVMLNRDRRGMLHLAGYAVPDRGRMVTYRLDLARVKQERRMARSGEPAPSVAGSPLVLLAARVD